ncbi:MAG: tetratricopeptide repeat protein [Acidobacteria bacterium]|nr:tetratricopeptide repeat protein [Acidobacteriota bacterium]
MRRHSIFALAFLALLLSFPAFAQVRVYGQVEDPEGKPIEGAKVKISTERYSDLAPAYTDRRGKWATAVPFGGRYEIDISKEGFQPFLGSVTVSEAARMPPLKATMQPKAPEPPPEPVVEEEVISSVPPEAVDAVELAEAYMRRAEGKATAEDLERLNILAAPETLPAPTPEERKDLYRKAIVELEKAQALLPEHLEIKKALARSYYAVGELKPAIGILETVHAAEPGTPAIALLLTNLYAEVGELEKARKLLDNLPADALADPTAVINVGILFLNKGEAAEAHRYFDRAVQADPARADAYYYRGIASLQLKNLDEAKADFRKVLELAPEGPEAADAQDLLNQLG